MNVIAEGLNFPTSIAFGPDGAIYVAESGLPFGGAPLGGRVWRIHDGERTCLVEGLRPPVNGLIFHESRLIISEGGHPGRISSFDLAQSDLSTLIDGLPGFGNYHTNMTVLGPDGKLYFSQGAMTNSGVIGLDSHDLGWLRYVPHNCDIPGYDIKVRELPFATRDPRRDGPATTETGPFAPFGTVHPEGFAIAGRVPCTSAVMCCNPDGSDLELVAWGLRNAYGLGFLPDGRLLATDQGADARGSRPLANCPDALFEILKGAWYGWPDFVCGRPVNAPEFGVPDATPVEFVLLNHSELPPPQHPLFEFEINCAAVKFDIIPEVNSTYGGQLLVALFGDERPMTGPVGPRVGRSLLRVNTDGWTSHPVHADELLRPIDVRFGPDDLAYVVDFGHFEITPDKGLNARAGTGRVMQLEINALED
jgi:Glucose / Sorbosone dehydrogenase